MECLVCVLETITNNSANDFRNNLPHILQNSSIYS